jgi:hypothetical protein
MKWQFAAWGALLALAVISTLARAQDEAVIVTTFNQ